MCDDINDLDDARTCVFLSFASLCNAISSYKNALSQNCDFMFEMCTVLTQKNEIKPICMSIREKKIGNFPSDCDVCLLCDYFIHSKLL